MSAPTIGIDFGTTTSSMAWVDPGTGKAEVLKNAEGEEKTPSVVWFGADAVLVGTPAEQMLDDEDERPRVVTSIKRELVNAPTLALPGRRVKAVQVAAEVLAKLRRDAEELHFQEPVTQAVVTCPAAFDALEREEIERAARLAGFTEVRLLTEPVAAALAYRRAGLGVGRHVLVYDLGGGTFDLALLREEAGGFELAMEPRGLRRCGGDDFDEALYDYFDEEAERQWGEPLNRQGRDLHFLRDCRKRKENLTAHDKVPFSRPVGEGRVLKHTLTREQFEDLIASRIDATVRLTGELVRTAEAQGFPVETVVLIGGSSRIPLVLRKLKEILPVEPRKWQHQDVAVALGAAYFAQDAWPERPTLRAPSPAAAPTTPTILALAPDGTGDCATFEQAVKAIPPGGTIRLLPGEYRLKAPFTIDKPMRLLGVGMDVTTIVGYWDGHVLTYAGEGRLAAEGITFRHEGTIPADVVVAIQGEVDFEQCRFAGGVVDEANQRYGHGLVLAGAVTGRIAECRAESNAGAGIAIRDQVQPTVEENVCAGNEAGITYRDSAGGTARKNRCVGNRWAGIGVGYRAEPTLEENVCEDNETFGIGYIGSAGGLARQNHCIRNAVSGIAMGDQAQPTLDENFCEGNKVAGIGYAGSAGGLARKNRCAANESAGILVADQTQPTLEENDCQANKKAGIAFLGSAGGLAHKNRCATNELSGIWVTDQAQPTLEENICDRNKNIGIVFARSAGGLARKNRCAANESAGILVAGQAQLEENVCEGNKKEGIVFASSARGSARKNRCAANESAGIAVQEQAQPTLEENVCEGNKKDGIVFATSAGGLARKNRCAANESAGIWVADQAQPTLEENVCEGNKKQGIYYLGNAGGLTRNNRCAANESAGIWVGSRAQPTLEENVCERNKKDGIVFFNSAGGCARKNRCAGNEQSGIELQDSARPTLEGNVCEGNKQIGIVYRGSTGGLAGHNHCARNTWSGIAVSGQAQPTLEENVCAGNQQDAIDYFSMARFSQLMNSKSLAETKLKDAVVTILSDCTPAADLSVRPSIPAQKLENARVTCQVPSGETILGLIDCTIWGSAKDAVLFGTEAMYFRNAGVGKMPYSQFPSGSFSIENNQVRLTPQLLLSLSGSNFPVAKTCQILLAIKAFLNLQARHRAVAEAQARERLAAEKRASQSAPIIQPATPVVSPKRPKPTASQKHRRFLGFLLVTTFVVFFIRSMPLFVNNIPRNMPDPDSSEVPNGPTKTPQPPIDDSRPPPQPRDQDIRQPTDLVRPPLESPHESTITKIVPSQSPQSENIVSRPPRPPQPMPDPTVQAIQSRLRVLGYYSGVIDGLAGKRTRSAISAFQRDNGIVADGLASLDLLGFANATSARPPKIVKVLPPPTSQDAPVGTVRTPAQRKVPTDRERQEEIRDFIQAQAVEQACATQKYVYRGLGYEECRREAIRSLGDKR